MDTLLGRYDTTFVDKICICIKVKTIAEFKSFLPNNPIHTNLTSLVFFYLGYDIECDIQLSILASNLEKIQLDGTAQNLVGTSWIFGDQKI